jgi:hypothetical protein
LSSANLLGNSIGVEQAQALLKIKEAKPGLTTLCGLSGEETELDLSGKKLGRGCAILLASEMDANGSLSSLTFNGGFMQSGSWNEGAAVTIDTITEEADFSGKKLGVAGAQILAAFMARKFFEGNESLSKLNLSSNYDGPYSGSPAFIRPITNALKTNTTITELDLSKNKLNFDAAKILSEDIQDMGSLSKLDLSGNGIGGSSNASPDAMTALGASLVASGIVDLNISKNNLKAKDIAGFAEHLKDMGSLASLDISDNNIGDEQEAKIKQICAGKSIKCTL